MSDEDEVEPWLAEAARAPSLGVEIDLLGRRLGRYRVDEVIGRGGMGVVYLAEDERLRRIVALKVLPPARAGDAERRRRFVREARVVAKLAHPSIATLYDAGEVEDRAFLAMEYVKGRTLRDVIADGPLAVDEVLRIGRSLAAALAVAHDLNIVHRDVKPDNVMLGEDGSVKLLDFGIAKGGSLFGNADLTAATREGEIVGTPQYMAPEQARGTAIDARTDVFALGVTLYEMAAGQPPFEGKTSFDVLVAIDRDEPVPLRQRVRAAPAALERLVVRCLRKDPADRHASASDVLRALERIDGGRTMRPRMQPMVVGVAALAVIAGIFGVLPRLRAPIAPPPPPTAVASSPVIQTPSEPAASTATNVTTMTNVTNEVASTIDRPSPPPPKRATAQPRSSANPSPPTPGPLDESK